MQQSMRTNLRWLQKNPVYATFQIIKQKCCWNPFTSSRSVSTRRWRKWKGKNFNPKVIRKPQWFGRTLEPNIILPSCLTLGNIINLTTLVTWGFLWFGYKWLFMRIKEEKHSPGPTCICEYVVNPQSQYCGWIQLFLCDIKIGVEKEMAAHIYRDMG